ncbi:MAG TPA: sulfotransferase domain-containing protein [Fulvivirga sp.]|nr:sulfotransferase domain-containing protein [Fulvivirga sp.]
MIEKLFKPKPRKYLFNEMDTDAISLNSYIFCVGMGRSGTHFMAELLGFSNDVASYHLDEIGNPVGDSYYQYAKWYGINVDPTPMFTPRIHLGNQAMVQKKVYCEANPYLSLHVPELLNKFKSQVIVLFRDPKKVVESHYNKGWYHHYNPQFDSSKYEVPGFEYSLEKAHYFFGRFFPKDPQGFEVWSKYTTVGKIAWMWSTIYTELLKVLKNNDNCKLVEIQKFNYTSYSQLTSYLAVDKISEKGFLKILNNKPGKGTYTKRPEWNKKEQEEFNILTNQVYTDLLNQSWI